jgi:hypothetical protein
MLEVEKVFIHPLTTKGPSISDVTALGIGDIKDFVVTALKP